MRLTLQILGDLTGLGINYFDFDNVGYVKTATEVSSDNSALMLNIRKHENALQQPIADVSRALLACARGMGEAIPDEGDVRVLLDDSIIQDTEAEKARDMKEAAAGLMKPWEYRMRWYGGGRGHRAWERGQRGSDGFVGGSRRALLGMKRASHSKRRKGAQVEKPEDVR